MEITVFLVLFLLVNVSEIHVICEITVIWPIQELGVGGRRGLGWRSKFVYPEYTFISIQARLRFSPMRGGRP